MKKVTVLLMIFCVMSITEKVDAQSFKGLDKSPLDMAYFPNNFAHDRREGDKAVMRVIYSRPQKKDREVFGKMVRYGKVWRTGANEATEIKLYQEVTFAGKKLAAGTYALFTIPNKDKWEIIFNKDLDYWGAYRYDQSKDALRVSASVDEVSKVIEAFSISFSEDGEGKGIMKMGWDKKMVSVPFTY